MALALDILSWALLVCGGIFTIIGGIGMIRLPDVFSRMHSAGITETVGAGISTILMLGTLSLTAHMEKVPKKIFATAPDRGCGNRAPAAPCRRKQHTRRRLN